MRDTKSRPMILSLKICQKIPVKPSTSLSFLLFEWNSRMCFFVFVFFCFLLFVCFFSTMQDQITHLKALMKNKSKHTDSIISGFKHKPCGNTCKHDLSYAIKRSDKYTHSSWYIWGLILGEEELRFSLDGVCCSSLKTPSHFQGSFWQKKGPFHRDFSQNVYRPFFTIFGCSPKNFEKKRVSCKTVTH